MMSLESAAHEGRSGMPWRRIFHGMLEHIPLTFSSWLVSDFIDNKAISACAGLLLPAGPLASIIRCGEAPNLRHVSIYYAVVIGLWARVVFISTSEMTPLRRDWPGGGLRGYEREILCKLTLCLAEIVAAMRDDEGHFARRRHFALYWRARDIF